MSRGGPADKLLTRSAVFAESCPPARPPGALGMNHPAEGSRGDRPGLFSAGDIGWAARRATGGYLVLTPAQRGCLAGPSGAQVVMPATRPILHRRDMVVRPVARCPAGCPAPVKGVGVPLSWAWPRMVTLIARDGPWGSRAGQSLGGVAGEGERGGPPFWLRTYARPALSSESETRPPRGLIAGTAVEKRAVAPIASASSIMHVGGPAVGRPIGRTVVAGGGARDV